MPACEPGHKSYRKPGSSKDVWTELGTANREPATALSQNPLIAKPY